MRSYSLRFAALLLLSIAIVCAADVIRVTNIGDSITQGGGCGPVGGYSTYLQRILGPSFIVTNAGCSGMTQLKLGRCGPPAGDLGSCSYRKTDCWKRALSSSPDIVTIMLGTNDAKQFNWQGVQQNNGDFFALDYVDMIQELRRNFPMVQIFVMVPPPLVAPFPFQMNATVINDIFPKLMRDIANVMQAPIVDIYSAMGDYKSLTCDGCHPTAQGFAIIANAVAQAITSSQAALTLKQ